MNNIRQKSCLINCNQCNPFQIIKRKQWKKIKPKKTTINREVVKKFFKLTRTAFVEYHLWEDMMIFRVVAPIGEVWGWAAPSPRKVEKDFCHSGESVLDLTVIRTTWDVYLKLMYSLLSTADNSVSVSPVGEGWFKSGYERSPVGSTPKVLLKWRYCFIQLKLRPHE